MDPNSTGPKNGQPDLSSILTGSTPTPPFPDPNAAPPMPGPDPTSPLSNMPTSPTPEPAVSFSSSLNSPTPIPPFAPSPTSSWPPSPIDPPLPTTPSESTSTPPAGGGEPIPSTFEPYSPSAVNPATTPTSPLDNPLGTPTDATTPNWSPSLPTPASALPSEPPSSPFGQAPTDLSHLIDSQPTSNPTETTAPYTTAVTQPETLVVSPDENGSPTPNIPTQENDHKPFPKWIIGLGVALLIIVVGASGYLILGVGQTEPPSVSTPAVQQNQLTTPPSIAPTPTPAATESGSFGALDGATPTPQASSAADLIRQRQQGR